LSKLQLKAVVARGAGSSGGKCYCVVQWAFAVIAIDVVVVVVVVVAYLKQKYD
jgi:hypothetical protein